MSKILTSKLYIVVKVSKKTGKKYWRMRGENGEPMGVSQKFDNNSRTYFKDLMKRFENMGFIIKYQPNTKP